MEDDHVDRPGVQARRRVELTGTNRPIGLIALMIPIRRIIGKYDQNNAKASLAFVLRRSGDLSEEPQPDPISNSAVKLLSADGTVSQDPGE